MKHVEAFESYSDRPNTYKKLQSKIDPNKIMIVYDHDDTKYTDKYTQETLIKSDYGKNKKITCPLCKKGVIKIDHAQTKKCPECSMEMTNYGNALICKIDNKTLNLYKDLDKYNI